MYTKIMSVPSLDHEFELDFSGDAGLLCAVNVSGKLSHERMVGELTSMTTTECDIHSACPPTLDHIVGQKRAVKQLKTAIEAVINDRAAAAGGSEPSLGHILLVGPPGVGKSMLAHIIAHELGSCIHEELAQNIHGPAILQGLLMLADPHDCVFVDEVHELHGMTQTTLYRSLEGRQIFLPPGPDGKRQVLELPPFTFVAATTDEWALARPLRDRFQIIARLDYYSDDELASLITQRARRLQWNITDAAVRAVASRGRGTPRLALRILEATRRTARAEAANNINIEHVRRMAEIEGLDHLGLDPLEQRYLTILREAGQPVRLNVLATRLGLPRATIERVIESDLIRLGLISKDDSGRVLTTDGRRHVTRS